MTVLTNEMMSNIKDVLVNLAIEDAMPLDMTDLNEAAVAAASQLDPLLDHYLETYHEMTRTIWSYVDHNDDNAIKAVMETQGTGGMWELAKAYADEFETIHRNTEWDGEFYDAIDDFVEAKSKAPVSTSKS